MDTQSLLMAIPYLVALILSLTVHEFAHAWSAYQLDDDTAARQGRMTLDPTAHIDPIGTILFPLIAMFSGIPLIGWAKPVPVNPLNFTRRITMRTGMSITAAAGPAANLVLALIASLVHFLLMAVGFYSEAVYQFVLTLMMMNIALAFFNLIPVPPLDGSKIFAGILPRSFDQAIASIERYGMIILYVLLFTGGLGLIFKFAVYPIADLLWSWPEWIL